MVWSLSPQCPVTTDRSRPLTGQTEAKTKLRGRGRAGRRCVVSTASSDPPVTGGRHAVVTRHAVRPGTGEDTGRGDQGRHGGRHHRQGHQGEASDVQHQDRGAVSGVRLMHSVVRYRGHHHERFTFLMIKLGHSHLWDLVLGCSGSSGNMCHLKNCFEHWMYCDNNPMQC